MPPPDSYSVDYLPGLKLSTLSFTDAESCSSSWHINAKLERKTPLWRPKRRREDSVRMGLRDVGWECVDWIHLALDRDQWRAVVITVMNLRVPQKVGNFLTSWVTVGFWRSTLLYGVTPSLYQGMFMCINHWFSGLCLPSIGLKKGENTTPVSWSWEASLDSVPPAGTLNSVWGPTTVVGNSWKMPFQIMSWDFHIIKEVTQFTVLASCLFNRSGCLKSRRSSVIIQTGLWAGRPEFNSRQVQWWDFFLCHCGQADSGTHPASYPMLSAGLFP
jgi:hypothetical protein